MCCLKILAFLLLFPFWVAGQGNSGLNPNIKTRFLKDSIQVKENVFYFNSLSVTNTSGKPLTIKALIDLPCFANLISGREQNFSIQPGETSTLSLRFAGNAKNSCNVNWLPVTVSLEDPSVNLHSVFSFFIKPSTSFKWKNQLVQPLTLLTDKNRNIHFAIRIENSGNIPDHYKIDLKTELPVEGSKQRELSLAPGESKIEDIEIRLSEEQTRRFKNAEITIILENADGDKRMLIQKISKLENLYRENEDAWQRLPLNVELDLLNIIQNNANAFVRLWGNTNVGRGKNMSFNYQSPNYFKNGSVLKNGIQTVQLNMPMWSITAGSLTDFNQFNLYGNGIRARYTNHRKNWVEATYNKSKLGNIDQVSIRTEQRLSKKIVYTNNSFANLDHDLQSNGLLSIHKLQWKENENLKMSVEGGTGIQHINTSSKDTSFASSSAGFFIEKSAGKIQGSTYLNYFSKGFPGNNKGLYQFFQDIRYKIGRFDLGSYIDISSQAPFIYNDTFAKTQFNYISKNISGRLGYNTKRMNLVFLPGVYYQLQDSTNSFEAIMPKLTTNLYYQFKKRWQLSWSNNIGQIQIPQIKEAGTIFSMYNLISLQSEKAGLVLRYDMGPYIYFEIRNYLKTHKPVRTFQLTPYYNSTVPKYNLDIRSQLNYSYYKPLNESSLSLINNIFWQPSENGWGAGLNATIDAKKKTNNMINLFVRKKLNVPVYRKRSYKNIRIVLFKDTNQDNQKSDAEETVNEAQVLIEKILLQTNEKGQLYIENFHADTVNIDFSTINNLAGWIPAAGYKQTLLITNDKVVFIPFKKAKLITGKLVLDKDEKSESGFDVAGIRITAIGRAGNTFSTLTGGDGTFYLSVLDDEYTLSINQNVFDEEFKVIDPVRTVDLVNNRQVNAIFLVRQKRRQINIKKQQ